MVKYFINVEFLDYFGYFSYKKALDLAKDNGYTTIVEYIKTIIDE